MSATESRTTTSPVHQEHLSEERQQAIKAVEQALEAPPKEVQEKMTIAKRAMICLRDDLIGQLRQADSPFKRKPIAEPLRSVNASLSLLVGVEYPTAGIQRKHVEQARDLLKDLFTPEGGSKS